MLLFSFHLLDFCLELIDQDLLLVEFLLELLHPFEFIHRNICRLSFLSNLCLMSQLRFLLLFLLRGYQYLISRDLFLELGDFIFRNDQLAIGLAPALLKLVYMRLKLLDHISQLLVLVSELCLDSLKPHLIDLGILHLDFLHLRRIETIVIFKSDRAELNFKVSSALLSFSALALLL